jgi:hypothetical protein
VIVNRLAGQNGRPLLSGPDRLTRVAALLAQRAGVYEAIPLHIDTSHLAPEAAAECIMGLALGLPPQGHRIRLKAGAAASHETYIPPYDILLAEGVLDQAGRRLVEAGVKPARCALVTNPTVGREHAPRLVQALQTAGFEPQVFEIPEGEA